MDAIRNLYYHSSRNSDLRGGSCSMKTRILVLDAFTNRHEAALVFIQRQGWLREDYEIIFCGTHTSVLKGLIDGPAYAVVPVRNSITGEVIEVTENLSILRGSGFNLRERDRFDLQINHCLMAPEHINRAEELRYVVSHEKALQQCQKYLNKIHVLPDRRLKYHSTGAAAKIVARLGRNINIGAIAPKIAAREYGLRILAENIQDIKDIKDNRTTFVLLENLIPTK